MNKKGKDVFLGLGLTWLFPALALIVFAFLNLIHGNDFSKQTWLDQVLVHFSIFLMFIGVVQLFYVLPLMFVFWRKNKLRFVWGLGLGAMIIIIANVVGVIFLHDIWSRAILGSTKGNLGNIKPGVAVYYGDAQSTPSASTTNTDGSKKK